MADHARGVDIDIGIASGVLPCAAIVGGASDVHPSHAYDHKTGSSNHATPVDCNSGDIVMNSESRTMANG